jgi:threonylcarbamoyladenosine tRNA methylthiotransferase MtaB
LNAPETGTHSGFVGLQEIAHANETDTEGVSAQMLVGDIFAHTEVLAAPVFEGLDSGFERTRANLKVQDGCNNRCSFCIIPFVRGQSRSLDAEKVVAEAEQLVRAGFQEIVLSGINLGRWGRDLARKDRFTNLLRYVLRRTSVSKLRISSVEPMDWTDELIELVATEPRIAKHAHLPLQSGSDRVLRMMHRKYRPWHYEEKIQNIRSAMPHAAIGADVMVGFPGETDELFRETYDFIDRLPFTYLHVFTFSARPGTPAATMPNQVPAPVARERNRKLRDLIARKNADFRRQFVGTRMDAITLARTGEAGFTDALSDNFLKLSIAEDHAPNQWVSAEIVGLSEDGLTARLA